MIIDVCSSENILSEWLESLIGCISTSNINIQAIAMGTLLDLVNVSLCCLDESTKTDTCTPNVVPVISGTDFYMLDHSQVYKVCSKNDAISIKIYSQFKWEFNSKYMRNFLD